METGFVRGRPPVNGMDFDKSVRTLSQYLKAYGYKTVGIHEGGFVAPDFGFDKGFDLYRESEKGADTTVDDAISFLDENRENKFFLFLHTYEVHAPYTHEYFIADLKGEGNDLKASQIARYDSGIRFTDEQIGRLINYLKETGLYEKTLIIITSDHGEHFDYEHEGLPGTHGWTLTDDETLVPLIIGGSDLVKTGKRVISQASAVDIVPTILDLLGDKNDYTFRGRSLLPLLGNTPVKEKAAYAEATAAYAVEQKSVRMSQYKLTAFEKKRMPNSFTEDFNYHFVDLMNDSEEKNDVSRKYTSKYRAYKKILLGLVRKIREKQSDLIETSERKSEIDSRLEDQLKALGYLN